MARWISGLVALAAFVALLVNGLMRESQVECEVCIDFEGQRACRTNRATDRQAAITGATYTACAVLSGGVTSGMQCTRTPPSALQCDD
jgi:hypothetical protein